MTCARCQRELEPESSFCRVCGAAVGPGRRGRRLRRMLDEGKIAGVCAGVAAYFDTDVTLVRLAWVLLSIVPGVLIGGVIAYVAAWVVIPVAGTEDRRAFEGKRLVRSETDRTVAGVCGGLAQYLGVDATLVRLLAVILGVYPGAVIGGVVAYLVAWIIIPSAAPRHMAESPAG